MFDGRQVLIVSIDKTTRCRTSNLSRKICKSGQQVPLSHLTLEGYSDVLYLTRIKSVWIQIDSELISRIHVLGSWTDTVLWVKMLIKELSPKRPRICSWTIDEKFLVDRVTMRQVRVLHCPSVTISPSMLHICISFIYHKCHCNIRN